MMGRRGREAGEASLGGEPLALGLSHSSPFRYLRVSDSSGMIMTEWPLQKHNIIFHLKKQDIVGMKISEQESVINSIVNEWAYCFIVHFCWPASRRFQSLIAYSQPAFALETALRKRGAKRVSKRMNYIRLPSQPQRFSFFLTRTNSTSPLQTHLRLLKTHQHKPEHLL